MIKAAGCSTCYTWFSYDIKCAVWTLSSNLRPWKSNCPPLVQEEIDCFHLYVPVAILLPVDWFLSETVILFLLSTLPNPAGTSKLSQACFARSKENFITDVKYLVQSQSLILLWLQVHTYIPIERMGLRNLLNTWQCIFKFKQKDLPRSKSDEETTQYNHFGRSSFTPREFWQKVRDIE